MRNELGVDKDIELQRKVPQEWVQLSTEEGRFSTGRTAPNYTVCTKPGCQVRFSGRKGWDDRLEHIWKHLDTNPDECKGTDIGNGGLKQWDIDNKVARNFYGRWQLNKDPLAFISRQTRTWSQRHHFRLMRSWRMKASMIPEAHSRPIATLPRWSATPRRTHPTYHRYFWHPGTRACKECADDSPKMSDADSN